MGSVLAETRKLIEFQSAHERPGNELQFNFEPEVSKKLWTKMHKLHPKTMALAFTMQGKPAQSRVGAALSQEGMVITFPLSFIEIDLAYAGSSQRVSKADLASVIIPSSSYLYELDPDNTRSVQTLKKEINGDRLMYMYLLCSDKTVEGWLSL